MKDSAPSRGRISFLALLLLIVIAAVTAALFNRVAIVNRWAPEMLADRLPIALEQFRITEIGWRKARIDHIKGNWQQGGRQLVFELDGIQLVYRPLERLIESVTIDSARVNGDLRRPPGTDTDVGPATAPPVMPLGIDRLDLDVQTDHGRLAVVGQLGFAHLGDRFRSTFTQSAYRLELSAPVDGDSMRIVLHDDETEPLIDAEITVANQTPQRITGSARLARLLVLLRQSGEFPALAARLADVALASGVTHFDISRLDPVEASVRGNLGELTFGAYRVDAEYELSLNRHDTGYRLGVAANSDIRIQSLAAKDRGDLQSLRIMPDRDFALLIGRPSDERLTVGLETPVPVHIQRVNLPVTTARLSRLQAGFAALTDFDLQLEQLQIPEHGISIASMQTEGRAENSDLQGRSRIRGVRSANLPTGLAPYATEARWRLQGDTFTARGKGRAKGLPTIDWKLRSQGRGGFLEASWREPAQALTPLMTRLIEPLTDNLELLSGTVTGTLRVDWRGRRQFSRLDAQVEDVGASLWGIALSSLDAHLSSDDVFNGNMRIAAQLGTAALGIGTEVRDTRLQASGTAQRLDLEELSFKALGGSVRLSPTHLDFARKRQELLLEIDGIDLAELLQTADVAGLSGTGRLSGRVPLSVGASGIAIGGGELNSLGPGVFRYRIAGDNPALDNIALAALRDFRFDSFRLRVDYGTDGAYRLKARIVGRNPDVLNGQLIALNPDIEGKLPGLLLAILIGDFDATLLEQLTRDADGPPGTDTRR